jgi:hypothetical protein
MAMVKLLQFLYNRLAIVESGILLAGTITGLWTCNLFNDAVRNSKISVGKPGRRWEDNIKMDLREIRWDDMDCIHLPQVENQWKALVNTVMSLRIP